VENEGARSKYTNFMPQTNHPPHLEILKNPQRMVKTDRTIKSFGLLMDNKLKGKPGICRTDNNSISRLRCVWPEPAQMC
jgi:hypothetical protein